MPFPNSSKPLLEELEAFWYARENGQGMAFGDEKGGEEPPEPPDAPQPDKHAARARKPVLKIVK